MSCLRLVLGDQLSSQMSSLSDIDHANDIILLMEIKSETDYAAHHKRKLAFVFSSMRHFADKLSKNSRVKYIAYNSEENQHDFTSNLKMVINQENIRKLILTEPAEYRLLESFYNNFPTLGIPFEIREDNRFLCSKEEFAIYNSQQKSLMMENFYHYMRKKTGYLMNKSSKPIGGKWNFDHDNRSPFKNDMPIPQRPIFKPDDTTNAVIKMVEKEFEDNFGTLKSFNEAVTEEQAEEVLQYFIEHCLTYFGKYQDAMVDGEPLMFHSRISHLLNIGLLTAKYVCDEALKKIDQVPLSSIEGFIRQVIGWREYIRGVYWTNMPDYVESNFFNFHRKLPEFYWNGKCKMNCVKSVVQSTERYAYSHHIQRLMITGNLALLMGIKPQKVHEWYLAVYDDAYEWVELPNTIGMALYADGGAMSTKPYISSGNYINKMSNFCKTCSYKVKEKTGPKACPFNYLYWNFLDQERDKLSTNRRLFMPYKNLNKKKPEEMKEIRLSAKKFIDSHCQKLE